MLGSFSATVGVSLWRNDSTVVFFWSSLHYYLRPARDYSVLGFTIQRRVSFKFQLPSGELLLTDQYDLVNKTRQRGFPSPLCQWGECLSSSCLILFTSSILKRNDLKHHLPPSSRISGILYQSTGS